MGCLIRNSESFPIIGKIYEYFRLLNIEKGIIFRVDDKSQICLFSLRSETCPRAELLVIA